MSEGRPSSRELLSLAKDAGLPSDAEVARARAALMEKIGAGIAAGAAVTLVQTAPVATKAAAWYSSLTFKVMTMAALLSSGAAGGYTYWEHRSETMVHGLSVAVNGAAETSRAKPKIALPKAESVAPIPAIEVPEAAIVAPIPTIEVLTPTIEAPIPIEAPKAAIVAPHPSPSTSMDRPKHAPTATLSRSAPEPSAAPVIRESAPIAVPRVSAPIVEPLPEGLTDDVRHLRAAQRALAQGDAKTARREAAAVRSTTLAEESEGMQALAACADKAPEGKRMAADFVRRWPSSVLSPRVRADCLR